MGQALLCLWSAPSVLRDTESELSEKAGWRAWSALS